MPGTAWGPVGRHFRALLQARAPFSSFREPPISRTLPSPILEIALSPRPQRRFGNVHNPTCFCGPAGPTGRTARAKCTFYQHRPGEISSISRDLEGVAQVHGKCVETRARAPILVRMVHFACIIGRVAFTTLLWPAFWSPRCEESMAMAVKIEGSPWRAARAPIRPLDFDAYTWCSLPPGAPGVARGRDLTGPAAVKRAAAPPEGALRTHIHAFARIRAMAGGDARPVGFMRMGVVSGNPGSWATARPVFPPAKHVVSPQTSH